VLQELTPYILLHKLAYQRSEEILLPRKWWQHFIQNSWYLFTKLRGMKLLHCITVRKL